MTWHPHIDGEPAIRDTYGNLVALTDWLGQLYRVGQRVMYCIGAGRGQMMAIGVIQQFREEPDSRWNYRDPEPGEEPNHSGYMGRPQVKTRIDFTVYSVQVLTERTSGHWNNQQRTRPAWVNIMNITALPDLPGPVPS